MFPVLSVWSVLRSTKNSLCDPKVEITRTFLVGGLINLADEGQCHTGAEETGSGAGSQLLTDRASLFAFQKRHLFLKILH